MLDDLGIQLSDVDSPNACSNHFYTLIRRFGKESPHVVIESLQAMILADHPSSYFHLTGGGINVIPPIQGWTHSSFTFACWIAPILEHEQALFSFEDDCGAFVAATIDCNGCIILSSSVGSSDTIKQVETLHPALVSDRWKFLCIRLARGRSVLFIGHKPQIEILVDMVPVSMPNDAQFDFPKISVISGCGIGQFSCLTRSRFPSVADFSGRFGAIYLFNERVTSCSVLSSIFDLGLDYCVPAITDPVNDNIFSRISNSLAGRTTDVLSLSCFVFAFHPQATENIYCTDTSPADCDTGAVTATLEEGKARSFVFPRLVDDIVLQSRLFLVLLDYIDVLEQDTCDIHAEVINTIQFVLSRPLHKHQVQLSDICSFFDAAGCVLKRKDARFISLRSAEAYHRLVFHIWKKHEFIPFIFRALSNHLLRLDWWIRPEVNSDARMLLAETCRTIILGQCGFTIFDLNAFIDRFHFYSCGQDQILLRVRNQLLTAINDLNESHYQDIISVLDDCDHSLHTAQLIEFLASHLNNETHRDLIQNCFDVVLACTIRFTESFEVLIATLHCLNVIFTCSSLEISCSVFNNVISSTFSALMSSNDNLVLRNLLYRSFLELFLSQCSPGTLGVPNIITWKLLHDPNNPQFTMPNVIEKVRESKLVHHILLFSTLPFFPDCLFVLKDILMFLQFPENKDVLLNQPQHSWQMPLFKLIKWDLKFFFSIAENCLIFEVVNAVLAHALTFYPNSSPVVRSTLSCLRLSAQQCSPSLATCIERLFFPGLIKEIQSTLKRSDYNYHEYFSSNICSFGDLIEEENWCSNLSSRRNSNTVELGNLSRSLDSNSSESWVFCSDELIDDPAGLNPLQMAEVFVNMDDIESLIDIILRCRLPFHVFSISTDDPHRCNLLQVVLNYLFEAISSCFCEMSISQLDKFAERVCSLVELASSDSCSLPGTNIAVVSFMHKTCTLLMGYDSESSSEHDDRSKIIIRMCNDVVRSFSPFIPIQDQHYDDAVVKKILTNCLTNRRFGELQTVYIHESENSALSMILPPFPGPIICIPIDIDFQSYSITVHSHTLQLISAHDLYSDSIQSAVIQSVYSSLNEISKCEQSSRSARFADCLRKRKLSKSQVQIELNKIVDDTFSNNILQKRTRRVRLNADMKQKKKIAFFSQEKICEMGAQYQLNHIKYFMQCNDLAFWNEKCNPFWGLSPLFSSSVAYVLYPWLDGTSHVEATHAYILQSHTNRLSFNDAKTHDSVPSLSLEKDLTIATNPNTEVDWDLCDVADDVFVADADGIPRDEGIQIEATLVTPIIRVNGLLRIDQQLMVFEQFLHENLSNEPKRFSCPSLDNERARVRHRNQWQMASLRSVQRRRYQLRHSALEFFFDIGMSVFFDFESHTDQVRVIREISLIKPPYLDPLLINPPRTILRKSDITRRWQKREISNFEYLRALNVISGRTFQDLNQYPIFPWVISDYTSESIDLSKPEVYRDLSKPIGAQNEVQAAVLAERYEHFVGSSIPPFHFGSHYSNAGIVIFYLLRLEPFSSLHIELQDGRFDFPDRLFSSVEQTFRVCTTNRSSVKELIPEFFTLPEMFVNCNKLDLGTTQSGAVVGNVQLPPWANDNPHKFVNINREALESEYVSANLPHWIDLIWGYKQRGTAAVEAFNVFYHLSYEGAVDLESVSDPVQREAMRSQISQWGQTPLQLFSKPHPHREPLSVSPKHLSPSLEAMPVKMMRLNENVDSSISNLSMINSKTIMVISECHTTNQLALNTNSVDGHFSLHPMAISSGRPDPTHPNSLPLSDCIVWSDNGRYVITGNHWDCSIRLYRFSLLSPQTRFSNPFLKLATYTLLQSLRSHTRRITCLAASKCQTILLSGSQDCNVFVWSMFLDDSVGDIAHIADKPLRVLIGHESPVICVAINRTMNICVSCSYQAMSLIHRLNDGQLIRRISFSSAPHSMPTCIFISRCGFLVFGCQALPETSIQSMFLLSYSLNGIFRHAFEILHDPVGVVASMNNQGDLIALANLGRITVYRVEDFSIVQSCHNVSASFTSVTFNLSDDIVIGGTKDGRIHVYQIN